VTGGWRFSLAIRLNRKLWEAPNPKLQGIPNCKLQCTRGTWDLELPNRVLLILETRSVPAAVLGLVANQKRDPRPHACVQTTSARDWFVVEGGASIGKRVDLPS
jgi:hypothetical protein